MIPPICHLTHTIDLVIWPADWNRAAEEHPQVLPASMEQLQKDITRLSCGEGIPVIMESFNDGTPRLVFCTERYDLGCALTEKRDAYKFLFASPLSFRRCNQLARQAIRVMTENRIPWRIHTSYQGLKTGINPQSGFEQIRTAWEQAAPQNSQKKADGLSPDHFKFLSDVENLIDLAREAALDSQNQESTVIRGFTSVPEERYSRSVYKFQVQDHNFKVGDYVLADQGVPGEKGTAFAGSVTQATKNSLTISFHVPVDISLLNSAQWIKPFTSVRQYEIQKSALRALRDRTSANPFLFDIIVKGTFADRRTPFEKFPPFEQFNASQSLAIGYAEQVEDMLLIIGPPGTGKTKSIAEISRRHAKSGKRVLITSKNNKAVDNALQKISEVAGLDILRIGREEAISDDVSHLKIDVRASNLQKRILASTQSVWGNINMAFNIWPQLEIALVKLEAIAAEWQKSIEVHEIEKQKLSVWEDEVYRSYRPVVERLQKTIDVKDKEIARLNAEIVSTVAQIKVASTFTVIPLVRLFINRTIDRNKAKIEKLELQRNQAVQYRQQVERDNQRIFESYKEHISTSADALERKKVVEAACLEQEKQETANQDFLKRLGQVLSKFSTAPQPGHIISPANIPGFAKSLRTWFKQIQTKHRLLGDWRDLLATRHQALYPSLIRMADVVGATCIGIATDARFEDLEFDLAIADEAGQIQVMDLLVPLVRAKRAILVGDHKQLPPIVDDGVKQRLNVENIDQKEWLEKSLFERIITPEARPVNRMVMLDTQYRIPPVIAEFISAEFYEYKYKTGHKFTHSDPFFDQPMVFIDTCEAGDRNETRVMGATDKAASYSNPLEANLIASLVRAYHDHAYEWGVIVPYKKQAELIRDKLKKQIPFEILNSWVATVDSFQGKERRVIIYGFTRSNPYKDIGFLRELRRLNVSLTRASDQLILVGNAAFLTTARDEEFSFLIRKLLGVVKTMKGAYIHANQLGNILSSRKISV